jgi:hypothetical protein
MHRYQHGVDFPFIGQVQQETVLQPNNGATMKQTINSWTTMRP